MRDKKKKSREDLQRQIDAVLVDMETYGPDSKEYPTLIENLERLTKLQQSTTVRRKVSPDTVMIVLGNLLGILVIVAYEQNHVIRSKAKDFTLKPPNQ